MAFVEITDPEQARKLREVGLLWYDDSWWGGAIESLRPQQIPLLRQRKLMADGYRYYVLLEE